MDLVKFQASLDAHTAALNTHSAAIAALIGQAGNIAQTGAQLQTQQAAASGEAPPAKRSPGRPTNAEKAAQQAAQTQSAAAANTAAVSAAANTTQTAQTTAAAGTASNGPLTHLAMADKFRAFAKAKGRDAIIALLKEFGATEFGKVKVEDLPLFNDRLDGKPQTPVPGDDMANLLGLG